MTDDKPGKRERTHAWTTKPKEEWTEEDWDDYWFYQNNRKPLRFQFGPDATEEDVDRFLDMLFDQKKDEAGEKGEQQD